MRNDRVNRGGEGSINRRSQITNAAQPSVLEVNQKKRHFLFPNQLLLKIYICNMCLCLNVQRTRVRERESVFCHRFACKSSEKCLAVENNTHLQRKLREFRCRWRCRRHLLLFPFLFIPFGDYFFFFLEMFIRRRIIKSNITKCAYAHTYHFGMHHTHP